ncbi:MAG: Pr6Pr family membrane protein, partial [Candidatus Izimaplasma sp.]|nr:Pr6Pr family membrane protein [Candidatus Izimaplasma bacterium]
YITPSLVIWYFFTQKENYHFQYKDIKLWAIYPIIYLVFVVVFGAITGDYLYPFFQFNLVKITGFIFSSLLLSAYFLALSFFVVKMVSRD